LSFIPPLLIPRAVSTGILFAFIYMGKHYLPCVHPPTLWKPQSRDKIVVEKIVQVASFLTGTEPCWADWLAWFPEAGRLPWAGREGRVGLASRWEMMPDCCWPPTACSRAHYWLLTSRSCKCNLKICYKNHGKTEAGGSGVQAQSGYIARPCLKKTKGWAGRSVVECFAYHAQALGSMPAMENKNDKIYMDS
jgi:hypothetical protein